MLIGGLILTMLGVAFFSVALVFDDDLVVPYIGSLICIIIGLIIVGATYSAASCDHADSYPAVDLDNCRYVGAEVFTSDSNCYLFIDTTSDNRQVYTYVSNKQLDTTAQYLLVIDRDSEEIIVVWQNME